MMATNIYVQNISSIYRLVSGVSNPKIFLNMWIVLHSNT